MKYWLVLLARFAVAIVCGGAAFIWLLKAVQVDGSWAHPILGRIFCIGIFLMCIGFGIMGVIDPFGEPKD